MSDARMGRPAPDPRATVGHFFSAPIGGLLSDFRAFLKLSVQPLISLLLLYMILGFFGLVFVINNF